MASAEEVRQQLLDNISVLSAEMQQQLEVNRPISGYVSSIKDLAKAVAWLDAPAQPH